VRLKTIDLERIKFEFSGETCKFPEYATDFAGSNRLSALEISACAFARTTEWFAAVTNPFWPREET
jgi:hypothetical protein